MTFQPRPFTKSLSQAAATTVYAAVSGDLSGRGGLYLNNCYFCEESPLAACKNTAKRLWKITEDLIRNRTEGWYNSDDVMMMSGGGVGGKTEKKTD